MRVSSRWVLKRNRWPPAVVLVCVTNRTRLFGSNSWNSWTTLPAAQLPLEPGAVADWSGVEPAGGPDGRVPVGPASPGCDDGKDLVNWFLDELSTGDK